MRTPAAAAARDPCERRPGKTAHRQLPGDRADDGTDEASEPKLAQDRALQRAATVDGREQHEAHLGGLEREWATSAPRAQPGRERERRDEADRGGPVLADMVDAGCGQLVVADEAGEEQDDDGADDAGDVGVVRRVEPVDLGDALAAAGAAQVAHCLQRAVECECGRHRRATLASSPTWFRTGGRRTVRVGAPTRPRRGEQASGPDARDLDSDDVDARGHARAAVRDDRGVVAGLRPLRSGRARPPRERNRPVSGSRSVVHGTLCAPGTCPARGSTGSTSPR